MDDEIIAVNLNCINYEDPTNVQCNGGWFFRNPNPDFKEFLKYPSLKFNCIGNNILVNISDVFFSNDCMDGSQEYLFLYLQTIIIINM